MSEKTSREEMLARIRAKRREADLSDAGFFLQQTITADLADRGELRPDEAVELRRGENGQIIVEVVKDDGLSAEEAEMIRRGAESLRELDLAAQSEAAPVVAESMTIWERDEDLITD